jgi:hypothetical protein
MPSLEETEKIREQIKDTNRELVSLSYQKKELTDQVKRIDHIYYGLWHFKDALERKLVKVQVIKTHKPKPADEETPLDMALRLLPTLSCQEIRALLAEMQGSEEEGKEIEYVDRKEVNEIT